jgi:RimJ/RimL family protein N-acetyltransferase
MADIRVRAFSRDDDLSRLEPVWGSPLQPSAVEQAPTQLVATRGDVVVGLALGRDTRTGLRIDALFAVRGSSERTGSGHGATREILTSMVESRSGERVELHARDLTPQVERLAEEAGFRVVSRMVAVEGSISEHRRPANRPFTFRRYHDAGWHEMLWMLAAIWSGGPGPTGREPDLELDEFLDLACGPDGRPDTSLWRLAYLSGHPAGAYLGLRRQSDPRTGVLLYVGLLPHLRGRGLGGTLHAEALWALRLAGIDRYQDSTASANDAMRRIFERAGCQETATSVLMARSPAGHVNRGPQIERTPSPPLGLHVSLLRKIPMRPSCGGAQFALTGFTESVAMDTIEREGHGSTR